MLFADLALARRLEAAEAVTARGCVPQQPGACSLEIAGGCAIFAGPESPLTQAVGIGLAGPVSQAQLAGLEAFFRSRGARVVIDLCPLADAGLVDALAARGYRATEFHNVLVKTLASTEVVLAPRARRATAEEAELWAHTVGHGFFEQPELTNEEMDVGRAIFAAPGVLCYLSCGPAGEPAGGGALTIVHGLAALFADTTLRQYRRQGLQRELIAARLNEALAQGCDLAMASTDAGSASQRNYEYLGFRVAYTKVTMQA
jgi:GNAT superfamily N-acetyltransferase